MSRVVLSPKAKSDLSDIWDYTLEQWGLDQAEKYIRELWVAIEQKTGDPKMSIAIGDVRKDYRKIVSGSHVIFFKLMDDGVDIVRILHQRMDFERHF